MGRPFQRVLIANRGEIAVRIIRACRAAGLRSIAIYSEADADALHTRLADEAYLIGPPPAVESYLDGGKIVDLARRVGAEAVHPGYGFLSERADFAARCLDAGLIWIGPPPEAMRLLGDKAAAKSLAERVGVPTLPGYHGDDQGPTTLRRAADEIGYPLLVKAAAGGGGRGMRLVAGPEGLDEALQVARRESEAAFGSGLLLLERYLPHPRHVEVQVIGDEQGRLVALGERDCSTQRRHQKIVEEAPAPGLTDEQRTGLGRAAVALAGAAGYVNAGTVEFLLEAEGSGYYFLEMNTRLQVEHPVTELVTGLDLVRLQFLVAAGEPLPLNPEAVHIQGHAIEARLYAENPWAGFAPSSGRLERLSLPLGQPGIRVDDGVEQGDLITAYYDPLLAKIVAHAPDRARAIDCLLAALAETEVGGVRTNLALLEAVLATPAFRSGQLETRLLEESGLAGGPPQPTPDMLMALVALEAQLSAESDPWLRLGPWRQAGVGSELCYAHGSGRYRIRFSRPARRGDPWVFELPDGQVEQRTVRTLGDEVSLEWAGGSERLLVQCAGRQRRVGPGLPLLRLELVSGIEDQPGATQAEAAAGHDVVRAPMPGRVARLAVQAGDRVAQHQTVVVLEAMKIEHLVGSPRDGVVAVLRCREGDQVDLGAVLVELEE